MFDWAQVMENVVEEFASVYSDWLIHRIYQQTQVCNAERLALSGGKGNRSKFEGYFIQ